MNNAPFGHDLPFRCTRTREPIVHIIYMRRKISGREKPCEQRQVGISPAPVELSPIWLVTTINASGPRVEEQFTIRTICRQKPISILRDIPLGVAP